MRLKSVPSPTAAIAVVRNAADTLSAACNAIFHEIASNSSECHRVQPLTRMDPKQLPPVSFITPNECSDAHSCALSAGDTWLAHHVPALLGAGADVIVTYDEGTTDLGAGGSTGGGQVFAVEAGRECRAGSRSPIR